MSELRDWKAIVECWFCNSSFPGNSPNVMLISGWDWVCVSCCCNIILQKALELAPTDPTLRALAPER